MAYNILLKHCSTRKLYKYDPSKENRAQTSMFSNSVLSSARYTIPTSPGNSTSLFFCTERLFPRLAYEHVQAQSEWDVYMACFFPLNPRYSISKMNIIVDIEKRVAVVDIKEQKMNRCIVIQVMMSCLNYCLC